GVECVAGGAGAAVGGVTPLLQAGGDAALGRCRAPGGAALVAGPAEVGALARIDLLPRVPPHVADVGLVGHRMNGEAEGVPQAPRVDFGSVALRAGGVEEGVGRQAAAGGGIDAHDLARKAVEIER